MANDHKAMGHAGGKSVLGRERKKLKTGEHDTKLHDMGKAWPRKHNNELRTSQEMEGKREGEMHGNGEAAIEGKMSPQDIADLMEDTGAELQQVFDNYAHQMAGQGYVSLAEFAEYAAAYGIPVPDENILEGLLANNQHYMFQEHRDSNGRYWTAVSEAKCMGPHGNDDGKSNKSGGKAAFCTKCYTKHKPGECKSESATRQSAPINEAKRDYEEVAPENLDDIEPGAGPGDLPGGEESYPPAAIMPPSGFDGGGEFGDGGPGGGEFGGEMGGEFGDEMGGEMGGENCPECPGMLDEMGSCPDCGYSGGGEGSMGDEFAQDTFHDPADDSALRDEWGYSPARHAQAASHQQEDMDLDEDVITEEDMPHYKQHQGAPGDHQPAKADNDAELGNHGKMGHQGGTSVNPRRLAKNSGLPQEPTNTKGMGKEWPRKQKSTGSAQEEFGDSKHGDASDGYQHEIHDLNLKTKQKNTGAQWEEFGNGWLEGQNGHGLSGGAKKMHENVERLGRHVLNFMKKCVLESGLFRRGSKYKGQFMVSAGEYVQPRQHNSMTEAVVDTEELLQIFEPQVVTLEARYLDDTGQTVLRQIVPLPKLPLRGPLMSESKALFRFPELARDYADMLVEAGETCSALTHNWGAAVSAAIGYNKAMRAYHAIREGTPPVV